MSNTARYNSIAAAVGKAVGAAFPELVDVTLKAETSDGGGGVKHTAENTVYSDVPAAAMPRDKGNKDERTGRLISVVEYVVRIPCRKTDGSRVALEPQHRLTIKARSPEPARLLQIKGIKNHSGIWWECICEEIG